MTQLASHHRGQIYAASGLDLLAAIWLLFSPYVLMLHSTTITVNNLVAGVIIGVLAFVRLASASYDTMALSWINALVGVWVLISPWALHFSRMHTAMSNNVAMGIIVFILACWSAMASMSGHSTHEGGGPTTTA